MGQAEIALDSFTQSSRFEEPLINGKGKLIFNQAAYENKISFLDYIMGGCEIQVHVAIDWTMSNKPQHESSSLHYLPPGINKNKYTDAIYNVLNIL